MGATRKPELAFVLRFPHLDFGGAFSDAELAAALERSAAQAAAGADGAFLQRLRWLGWLGLRWLRRRCVFFSRCRLCEVFSLKSYKIDHPVFGAIASAVVYGTMLGASHRHIEHAIGMIVSHYIPWRAIRAGK